VTCLLARTLAVASVALMSMSSGLGAAPQVEHLLQKSAVAQMGLEGLVEDIPDAMVPMRDGVRLSTAVYIPKNAAGHLPTVMIRTPYPRGVYSSAAVVRPLIENGYVVVIQNERGTSGSEGEFHVLGGARKDGYDTIDWIVAQSWSNGNVGAFGCSSPGENQMALSAENHPALKAIIPVAAGAGIGEFPGIMSQALIYKGGVPSFVMAGWFNSWGYIHRPHLSPTLSDDERNRVLDAYALKEGVIWTMPSFSHLPSKDILRANGTPPTDWDTFILREPGDKAWRSGDWLTQYDQPRAPALFVSSWYDVGATEELKAFEYQQDKAPNQFIVFGPTGHCGMGSETAHTLVGMRDVGDARYDYLKLYLSWFDYWLKGTHNGVLDRPRVQYFLPGANEWRTSSVWPPQGKTLSLYLNSGGHANTRKGDGVLQLRPPSKSTTDQFRYNPLDPVPTAGGGLDVRGAGAVVADQASVEGREDVLVYTSDVLDKDLDVVGNIRARLYVSSSVKDTDLTFRLVDVSPDGTAFNIGDTILRLRYRNGAATPQLMTRGEIYPVDMPDIATANRFPAGHRVRIQVSSSNFPLYERNLNTGGRNAESVDAVIAETRLHHGSGHLSRIDLPVVP
jgi:putative CocE/NonD family hydrolase